jgi:hypothetical protein
LSVARAIRRSTTSDGIAWSGRNTCLDDVLGPRREDLRRIVAGALDREVLHVRAQRHPVDDELDPRVLVVEDGLGIELRHGARELGAERFPALAIEQRLRPGGRCRRTREQTHARPDSTAAPGR